MDEPTTPEEVLQMHKILKTDPHRYIEIVNGWICKNPMNANAFFDRHYGWINLGQPLRALADLNKNIEMDPAPVAYSSRGEVYRQLGDYEKALADYGRAESMNPEEWQEDGFGLLFQADAHARLGNEHEALAHCARLKDDFWTPGLRGAPAGGKLAIAEELRRLAADARQNRPQLYAPGS